MGLPTPLLTSAMLSIDLSEYDADIYTLIEDGIYYPESDGKPMVGADWQAHTLRLLANSLESILPDAYIATDIFWYPVKEDASIVASPDLLIAFGRSQEFRSSYRQWHEDNTPPQVVFEIQSPANKKLEMTEKFKFYQQYGVQEYYVYYPQKERMQGYIRQGDSLVEIDKLNGWQSPLMKVWFKQQVIVNGRRKQISWHFLAPNGEPFLTYKELELLVDKEKQQREVAEAREAAALQQTEIERQQREAAEAREAAALQQMEIERQQREMAEAKLAEMTAKLHALGLNPAELLKH
jgi:Uma2 family endonuclease